MEWSEAVTCPESRERLLAAARSEPTAVAASNEAKGERLLLLARAFRHPRDEHISFHEPSHSYFLKGKRVPLSVSGFYKPFFSEFDAPAVIQKNIGAWRRNERSKYHPFLSALRSAGVPEERDSEIIQKLWNLNGEGQSALGTGLHRAIELHINEEPCPVPCRDDVPLGFQTSASAADAPLVPHLAGTFNLVPRALEWALAYLRDPDACGPEPDLAVPPSAESTEFGYYLAWKASRPELVPVRQEMNVWSEPHQLAGQLDALYWDSAEKCYILSDWKRTRQMETEKTHFTKYGEYPFDEVMDTNAGCVLVTCFIVFFTFDAYFVCLRLSHYYVQQNVYSALLRMNYGVDVKHMYLVQLHPNLPGFVEHEVPDLREKVEEALEQRRVDLLNGVDMCI